MKLLDARSASCAILWTARVCSASLEHGSLYSAVVGYADGLIDSLGSMKTAAQQVLLRQQSPAHSSDKTRPFVVAGDALPDVPFDIGESYAGLMPISGDADETRKLFFWYVPSPNAEGRETVTLWFNGGPGCSSLHGMLQSNGPFTWKPGTAVPVLNPYSWSNLTSMVFVEQPVGVGFSEGVPNISTEEELAIQFQGFYKQFVDTFDLHGRDVYLAGESYGGYYVAYVADAFIRANDTRYFNLKGININDAISGDLPEMAMQQNAVTVPLVDHWERLFFLNDTFSAEIHRLHETCGYADYLDKYLSFPPPQEDFIRLTEYKEKQGNQSCGIWQDTLDAIREINPCFKVWHMTDGCPHPYSQLGKVAPEDYIPEGTQPYFNRTDVQEVLHVHVGTNWAQCSFHVGVNVFGGPENDEKGRDLSTGPAGNGVLQRVIEATNNVFIGSGDLDFVLNTNLSLLAVQNITFNGMKGLERRPDTPLWVPQREHLNPGFVAGGGILGKWGTERGLTFYTSAHGGHQLAEHTPGVAYRVMEVMLGRIKDLSVVSGFSA